MTESRSLKLAIDAFLLYKSDNGLARNTIMGYESDLKGFLRWVGNRSLADVSPEIIDRYFVYLVTEHRISHGVHKTDKQLSSRAVKNIRDHLATFWKWTSEEYEIQNPFQIKPTHSDTKLIQPFSEEEFNLLLDACKNSVRERSDTGTIYESQRPTYRRDRAILLTLLSTGVRASELCDLKIGDVNFEKAKAWVNGKGGKRREVFFGKRAIVEVFRYMGLRFPHGKFDSNAPLFATQDGKQPMNRTSLKDLLRRLGEKAKVKNVNPHRFRHTFAIEFLRNGGDVEVLQMLLGHTSLEMVKNYINLTEADIQRTHRKASPGDHLGNWRVNK